MVIGPGRRDMVGGFFGEDWGIVGKFGGKGLFRFCLFGGSSKFSGSSDFGYLFFQRGTSVEEIGSTSDDSVKGSVCVCASQELGFFLPSVVLEESGISDRIDMDMLRRSIGGFLEMGVMVGGVSGVG